MSVMVVAEHRDGALNETTLEQVTAAQALERPLALVVVDAAPERVAGDVEGVAEVIRVTVPAGDGFRPELIAQALEALIAERRPTLVLAGFGAEGMSYAPALAVRCEAAFASDVQSLRVEEGALIATRPFYGGKLSGELELGPAPAIVLLRAGACEPAARGGAATESELALPDLRSRISTLRRVDPEPGDVDITSADVLLSVGRGIEDGGEIERLLELAEGMGATLSVSRPVVDAGWAPSARQVGQSGRTVEPRVYIALGISGASQHLAGMRGSGTVIAVNTDPAAAIFEVADYAATIDLFDVVEELERIYRAG